MTGPAGSTATWCVGLIDDKDDNPLEPEEPAS
jgi:hypothetical protein